MQAYTAPQSLNNLCFILTLSTYHILEREDITLGDILEFLSGASKLPAVGFSKDPSVHFCNEDQLPKASTCDVSITFSRGMGLLQYEQFKERMDLCILGSYGFGTI